ncbi:MAG: hypothetical protein ACO3LM_04120, partial [Steroidobacteraceae bacterium]
DDVRLDAEPTHRDEGPEHLASAVATLLWLIGWMEEAEAVSQAARSATHHRQAGHGQQGVSRPAS